MNRVIKALPLLFLLLGWTATAHAAPLWFSGMETGDRSELHCDSPCIVSPNFNNWTIQSTTTHTGNYAATATLVGSSGSGNADFQTPLFSAQTAIYARWYFYLHNLSAGIAFPTTQLISWRYCYGDCSNPSGQAVVQIDINTDSASPPNPSFLLRNVVNAATVGTCASTPDAWHLMELYVTVAASNATTSLYVDGASCVNSTTQNTGTNGITRGSMYWWQDVGAPTGTVYVDDVLVVGGTMSWPSSRLGAGGEIARQFKATAPAHDAWTKSTGSIWNVWDDTPFSAGAYANSSTSGAQQTGVTSFGSISDAGATGHGNLIIRSTDTINAAKVGLMGKTATTSGDAADSSIFRQGTTDTVTALGAGWGTADSYQETLLSSTPTASQLLSSEAGVQHAANTISHTIEDAWLFVDCGTCTAGSAAPAGVVILP
jgi:hypothetical protein